MVVIAKKIAFSTFFYSFREFWKPPTTSPDRYLESSTSVSHSNLDRSEFMSKEFTLEEVAKHNKEGDCWVIIDGGVYELNDFLPDHPGGRKAILTFAGRDATEEFDMLHDRKVLSKYVPKAKIGVVKKSKL